MPKQNICYMYIQEKEKKKEKKRRKNCQPTYYVYMEWSKLIYFLVYLILLVYLPWLLICNIYIYGYEYVYILLPSLKWWLLADMSLWPCHHHNRRRNSAAGLWWFMSEQMPLTLHWMRERKSNIDIWNKRKKKKKKDVSDQRILKANTYGTGNSRSKKKEIGHKCSFFSLSITLYLT